MKKFCVKYHKLFMVLLLVQIILLCAGCGPLTWLTDAKSIIPIVVNMVSLVLNLIATLSGGTILPVDIAALIAGILNKVLAGLKDIEAAVAEYEATPTTTTLSKIKAITQAVLDNLDGFLNDTLSSITNQALRDRIKELITLVLQEVVAFASLLPALQATPGQKLSIVVPMTSSEAKARWNAILAVPSGDAVLDAALANLKL